MADALKQLDITDIMRLIPHRYPMLLVDRADILEEGTKAQGYKAVTMNEPFFQGHFPQKPVMPGVLIIEAMAQTSAIVTMDKLSDDGASDTLVYFMSIDGAKFRRQVVPGDLLQFNVELERARGPVRRFACKAMVGDEVAAEATVQAMISET
ncbi:MAG: 3-hydroxyacyl-ACP dehydratase FabZ [Pseudomonadota bacterium]